MWSVQLTKQYHLRILGMYLSPFLANSPSCFSWISFSVFQHYEFWVNGNPSVQSDKWVSVVIATRYGKVPTSPAVFVRESIEYHSPKLLRASPNHRIFGLRNRYVNLQFRVHYVFGLKVDCHQMLPRGRYQEPLGCLEYSCVLLNQRGLLANNRMLSFQNGIVQRIFRSLLLRRNSRYPETSTRKVEELILSRHLQFYDLVCYILNPFFS